MLDLERESGLPLALGDDGKLVFGADVVVSEHGERLLDALTPVALDPEACRGSQAVAYYMDNGVYARADAARLAGVPMRYELTLLPAGRMGREYIKTHGHLHKADPRTGLTWAEVCEVVLGTAHFLFQTLDPVGPTTTKVWVVEAHAGQKVIFPPDLDHLTINPGAGPLLFSDVIALGVSGDYERFRRSHGAAYVEVEQSGRPAWMANPAYRSVPPLVGVEPREYPALDLTSTEPLYAAFVRTRGERWGFLTDPSRFAASFPDLAAQMHA